MHKLFITDILLILASVAGSFYLLLNSSHSSLFLFLILGLYILAKFIGFLILKYDDFDLFINHLIDTSKIDNFKLSGFEIFKTMLVVLLFLGFIFIDPFFWIVEAILVIMMRVWGRFYILNKNIVN